MNLTSHTGEPVVLAAIRTLLLAILLLGVVGTAAELLLIGHFEKLPQYAPLVLLGVSVPLIIWHATATTATTVRLLQLTMALFVVSGGIGVGLHFQGNEEFEMETHPSIRGWALVAKVLTGATPVLAPGSLSLLGLVGLAHTYRHPALHDPAVAAEEVNP